MNQLSEDELKVKIADLAALNAELDRCADCATVARGLRHVPGGGCSFQPNLMLVFINPTVGNITASADWPGPRFPFAGRPKLWSIVGEAGLVDADLSNRMLALGPTPTMVQMLIDEARRQRLYLTNAVKCVDDGSNLPTSARVAAALPFLHREIALVQPRAIVALGLIPFGALTGRIVRLADQLWAAQHDQLAPFPSLPMAGRSYPVFPCYFPTGRGNPVGATNMLKAIRRSLQPDDPQFDRIGASVES